MLGPGALRSPRQDDHSEGAWLTEIGAKAVVCSAPVRADHKQAEHDQIEAGVDAHEAVSSAYAEGICGFTATTR